MTITPHVMSQITAACQIIGFGFKMQTEDTEGRREEVTGDHIIMCGYLFFRPRKTGFILCLN
jgi:hypothetical protein